MSRSSDSSSPSGSACICSTPCSIPRNSDYEGDTKTLVGSPQIALILAVVIGCAVPLGKFIAGFILGERNFLTPALGPVERGLYRLAGVDPTRSRIGSATRSLWSSSPSPVSCRSTPFQRLQSLVPPNPRGFDAVAPDLAFNTFDQLHHQHQLAEL